MSAVTYIIIEILFLVRLDQLNPSISLARLKFSKFVMGATFDFVIIVLADDEVVVDSLYDLLYRFK